MRAALMYGAGDVRVEDVPDARLIDSTDALVRVTRAAICGSDLWPYKSMPHDDAGRRMGHEFIGVVEAVGVGDGAVGLRGVIASKRLGAERIILLGSNPERTALGQEFGATDVVRARGEEAVERVRELTAHGAHSVLECVGLEQAVETALAIARPGGAIGRVGVPEHDTTSTGTAFWKNASIAGGPAPVRAYTELLSDVLEGRSSRVVSSTAPGRSRTCRTATAP